MTYKDIRLGGPCPQCGKTQSERSGCTKTRDECPYGRDSATADILSMVTTMIPVSKPLRLARMLRLYVAATEGLTQKQVAQQAGVNESTLSRFLSGEQMPDGAAFAALLVWCLGKHEA